MRMWSAAQTPASRALALPAPLTTRAVLSRQHASEECMKAWGCHIRFQLATLRRSSGQRYLRSHPPAQRFEGFLCICVRLSKVERWMPSRRWSLNTKGAH